MTHAAASAASAASGAPPSASEPAAWRFPAEVRFANARETAQAASAAMGAVAPRFDLSECRHFDSSLLAVLLELERRAAARGLRCRFESPSANLLKLAALYNVDGLLFERALESALAAVGASAPPPQ
ncbi:MAG: STAS domain-containing protein [Burkholderiaceae bacterium]|nr:STAS domain-containing protein [Burkholderiaceae bacterium]